MFQPWPARGTASCSFILICAPYQTRVTSGRQVGREMTDSNTTAANGKVGPGEPNESNFSRGAGNPHVNVKPAIQTLAINSKSLAKMTKHIPVLASCLSVPDNELPPPFPTSPAFNKHLSYTCSMPSDL